MLDTALVKKCMKNHKYLIMVKKNTGFELKTGMAICIEPMFNLGSEETMVDEDGWTVKTIDGQNSAHWEHTIGLTEEGTRVFTETYFNLCL